LNLHNPPIKCNYEYINVYKVVKMSENESGMNIHLGMEAARQVRKLSRESGYHPVELVSLGLGLAKVAHDLRAERLRLAVVDNSGTPLREIIWSEPGTVRANEDDVVKNTEDHSSSLLRSIADLDPDKPKEQGHTR
jgi:hypothetical protein